jgi:outer membrane protein
MKKLALLLILIVASCTAASAQKFALVDMEYILKNVPSYEMANEQLNQISQRWQKEVEAVGKEAETMYQTYLSDKVFLTEEQVKKREQEIVAKEKEATELRYKYFGPEGELYKKRQSLLKPIQDDVYNAIKKVAEERGYQAIYDRASSSDIIYASPRIDISNEVLAKLGYSKLFHYLCTSNI